MYQQSACFYVCAWILAVGAASGSAIDSERQFGPIQADREVHIRRLAAKLRLASKEADTSKVEPVLEERSKSEESFAELEVVADREVHIRRLAAKLRLASREADTSKIEPVLEERSKDEESFAELEVIESDSGFESDSGGSCFPGASLVTLESGEERRMDEVQTGDRVLVAHQEYSTIFMWTHAVQHEVNTFLRIQTRSGHFIELSPGHYLELNGDLSPAASAKLYDYVQLQNGSTDTVSLITPVNRKGLYNPQTEHGDIVVNGVVASTYTTAVAPRVAHVLLAPLRATYRSLGMSTARFHCGVGPFAPVLRWLERSDIFSDA